MIYAVKKKTIGKFYQADCIGLFILGDNMLVHRKHDLKLYLGFRPVSFFKKAFCLGGGLCEGGSFVIFLFLWVMTFCHNFFIIIL